MHLWIKLYKITTDGMALFKPRYFISGMKEYSMYDREIENFHLNISFAETKKRNIV